VRRIGHKGADLIAPGNTIESFTAAVEVGVDVIELDVLRPREDFPDPEGWRRAPAGRVTDPGGPLVVAHDWPDAARRHPHSLEEVLDAFGRPPLDAVEIDLDLKVAGREDELVDALRARELIARSMVSTMEVRSLREIRDREPDLRLGWTLPRFRRDWSRVPWARPFVGAGLLALRRRLPGLVRREAPKLGVRAVWSYHPVITARLVRACEDCGIELYAWTVDDLLTMRRLRDLGVHGICTNDPRLFADL
jgi:glycerophosphoryl diester phosphodiesterase